MRKPIIDTFNGWKARRRYLTLLDIQLEVVILGITLVGIRVVIYRKPFDYDLHFDLLGFSVSIAGSGYKTTQPGIWGFNHWGQRNTHVAIDGGLVIVISGIRVVDLHATICMNPFDYELTFGVLGFAVTIGGGGNVRLVGSVFDE